MSSSCVVVIFLFCVQAFVLFCVMTSVERMGTIKLATSVRLSKHRSDFQATVILLASGLMPVY